MAETVLQDELWIEILSFVDLNTLLNVMCSCSGLHLLADSQISWRLRTEQHYPPITLSRWDKETPQKQIYKHYTTKPVAATNVRFNCQIFAHH
jgi:hypothetical protein